MAISLASLETKHTIKPPRICVYGVEGVGKTTFAAGASNPVFIWTEEGRGSLDVPGFPIAKTFQDVMDALAALYQEDHDFGTTVVDSLDWLEPLIWKQVCADKGVKSIEDIGYGKGYKEAVNYWREFIDGLMALRAEKNMAYVLIAHSTIKRFDSPETDPYDRYQIKLHETASAIIREHCDVVGFCNYHVAVREKDVGFNKKAARGVTSGERLLYLNEKPAFQAKNRYSMPDSISLDWSDFADHLAGSRASSDAATEAA